MAMFMYRLGVAISPLLGITQRNGAGGNRHRAVVFAQRAATSPRHVPAHIQAFFSAALETTGALTAGVTLVASRNAARPGNRCRSRACVRRPAPPRGDRRAGTVCWPSKRARRCASACRCIAKAGTADVNSVRCQVAWMGVNRDGAAPPRDLFVQP